MDIDKHQYPDAWRRLRKRLRVGGLVVVDNLVWSGRVAAGAVYTGQLRAGRMAHPTAQVHVIAKTRRIPYDAYVVRDAFPVQAREALGALLRSVTNRDAVRPLLPEQIAALAGEIGPQALAIPCDVSRYWEMEAAVSASMPAAARACRYPRRRSAMV